MRAVLLMYGNVHSQGMFYFARCSGAQFSHVGAQAWASVIWRLIWCFSHLQLQGLGYSHFDLLGYSHILQGLGYSYKVGVAWGMGSSNLYLPNRSSLFVS